MKFTKEKRHQIYKDALEWYLENNTEGDPCNTGICFAILVVIKDNDPSPYEGALFYYPEVMYQCPSSKKMYGLGYWFPTSQTKRRIAILKKAIKLSAS